MIDIITFLIILAILGVVLGSFSPKNYLKAKQVKDWNGSQYIMRNAPIINQIQIIKTIVAVCASIIIALINPIQVERVDSGYVAILVENTGDAKGMAKVEYKRGWVLYNSFTQRFYEFPTYQQHIEYEENTVTTKGGFIVTIKPSFNYSLNPMSVDNMFQNLRLDIKQVEQGWLKNAIISSVNDVANLYSIDSVFNHRAEFESAIVIECNKRVSRWFSVSQLRTNITPPKELTAAINNKTKAVQDAQAAVQRKTVAEAEAQEKIAIAKGDSAQAVISAAGKAEAIRKEQLNLTPLYIDYLKVQRWDGTVPQTVLGSNTSTLMNIK